MIESTFTAPRSDCDSSRYHAPDVMASEEEVSRFIGALVDLLHPDHVLETGSYLGYTSDAIGRALMRQGYGHLDSLERDAGLSEQARLMCSGLPVTIHHTDSLSFSPEHLYDLMFFDSAIEVRADEMERFRVHASTRCVWVLHDSRNPELMRLGGLQLPLPRGLSIGTFT